ncbi:hypothetical protein T440DRAFT_509482 [Plenodomus tracheiphilus IPT5]|uniref:Uncharacterized protein n=1 Tax=Plenodomus tracheiphilus IPT5 TaxID=1408161 RepID=A0A6A7B118_9PLEO|nr:hypothetical protein T440DRAFT_509482 [Plenodomus tracheiphilus IPT5]
MDPASNTLTHDDPDFPSAIYGPVLFERTTDSNRPHTLLSMSLLRTTERDGTHTIPIFRIDGRIEGGLHPPAYYAYSPSPPHSNTWEECLQEIEHFDWSTAEKIALPDTRSESTNVGVAPVPSPQSPETFRVLGIEESVDAVNNIPASHARDPSPPREISHSQERNTASQPPLTQQSLYPTLPQSDSTCVAPPSPPWIPSPVKPSAKMIDTKPSPSVSAAPPRGKEAEPDLLVKENAQKAALNIESIAAGRAIPTMVSEESYAPEILGESDVTENAGGDVIMGEYQDELSRAMDGVTLESDRYDWPAMPPTQSQLPSMSAMVACASLGEGVAFPFGPPRQQDTLVGSVLPLPSVETTSAPVSQLNNETEAVELNGFCIQSPAPRQSSTIAGFSQPPEEIHTHAAHVNDGFWETQLHKAAAADTTVIGSRLISDLDTLDEVVAVNALTLSNEKRSGFQNRDCSLAAHTDEDLAAEPPQVLSFSEPDVHIGGGNKAEVTNPTAELIERATSGENKTLVVQHDATGLIAVATRNDSGYSVMTPIIANATTIPKRKKPTKKENTASDSEEEAPDKKKMRTIAPNPMVNDENDTIEASVAQGKQKVAKTLKEDCKIVTHTESDKFDAPSTPSRFDHFAYGKYASPLKHIKGSDSLSEEPLEQNLVGSQQPDGDNDVDMDGHLSDITNAAVPETAEPQLESISTPESRNAVSILEPNTLSNSEPRICISMSEKGSVGSGSLTTSSSTAFDAELVALARPDTPTPHISAVHGVDEIEVKPLPKPKAKAGNKKKSAAVLSKKAKSEKTTAARNAFSQSTATTTEGDPIDDFDELNPDARPESSRKPATATKTLPKTLRKILPKPEPLPSSLEFRHPFDVGYGKRHTRSDTKATLSSGATSAAASVVGKNGSSASQDELGQIGACKLMAAKSIDNHDGSEFEAEIQDDDDDDEDEAEEPPYSSKRRSKATTTTDKATHDFETFYISLKDKDLTVVHPRTPKVIPSKTAKPTTKTSIAVSTSNTTTTTKNKVSKPSPPVLANKYGFRSSPHARARKLGLGQTPDTDPNINLSTSTATPSAPSVKRNPPKSKRRSEADMLVVDGVQDATDLSNKRQTRSRIGEKKGK